MDKNEEEKVKRLLDWSKEIKQGPFKIDIELHRRCNLSCLSCSRRADEKYENINEFSKKIEMPLEKWLNIVKEASELGVREWHIAGGGDPPFVPELLFPIMNLIKKQGMFGILTTNGTNLSSEHIKNLVEIEWDRIHFSIDGPNSEIHDYLRGIPGSFEKVTNSIKLLGKLRKGKEKPTINMNTVLSTKNYNKLPAMVKLAKKLGVEYMFVEPLIVYSGYGKKLKLKDEHRKEFLKYLEKAKALAKKYKIDSNFSSFDQNLDNELIENSSSMNIVVKKDMQKYGDKDFLSSPCYDPFFHMTIKADGRVTSCDIATDSAENISNKTLKEVWFGSYFENLRKDLFEKKIPGFCAQCNPSHTTQRRRLRNDMMELME
jgi:MoaA/NifB/PqqE/SkfB family radical SAM enzyme